MKDRSLSDEKEDGEEGGVENGGDCKNKGFGFVSFQASKSNSKIIITFCCCTYYGPLTWIKSRP